MKRIAIIGAGRIAPAHLEGLKLLSRAKVVAICDMNVNLRQERQKAFNIPDGFSSLDELLKWNEFDIAAVLTPPDVRSEVCMPIIKAKKHLRKPQRMPRFVSGDEFVSIFWTRCPEYAVGSCLAVCFVINSLHGNQKNQSCSL